MPERVTIYDQDSGAPLETFAVDAIEIVKSDPVRYAYRLPTDWAPKPEVTEAAPVVVTDVPDAPPAPEAQGDPAPPADNEAAAPEATTPQPAAPAADASSNDDAEKDALRAEAEGLGIDVDNRWGVATLKAKIAAAKLGAGGEPSA